MFGLSHYAVGGLPSRASLSCSRPGHCLLLLTIKDIERLNIAEPIYINIVCSAYPRGTSAARRRMPDDASHTANTKNPIDTTPHTTGHSDTPMK